MIIKNKYVYLPYLNFSDMLPETNLIFIWPDLTGLGRLFQKGNEYDQEMPQSNTTGLEFFFSYSTQLSTKLILLINVKTPTIADIYHLLA